MDHLAGVALVPEAALSLVSGMQMQSKGKRTTHSVMHCVHHAHTFAHLTNVLIEKIS